MAKLTPKPSGSDTAAGYGGGGPVKEAATTTKDELRKPIDRQAAPRDAQDGRRGIPGVCAGLLIGGRAALVSRHRPEACRSRVRPATGTLTNTGTSATA